MMIEPTKDTRILLQVSKPVIPGIFTSNRIRSGCSRRTAVIASLPFLASMTSYPLVERVASSTRRIGGSSSTTRILALFMGLLALSMAWSRIRLLRGQNLWSILIADSKNHHDSWEWFERHPRVLTTGTYGGVKDPEQIRCF